MKCFHSLLFRIVGQLRFSFHQKKVMWMPFKLLRHLSAPFSIQGHERSWKPLNLFIFSRVFSSLGSSDWMRWVHTQAERDERPAWPLCETALLSLISVLTQSAHIELLHKTAFTLNQRLLVRMNRDSSSDFFFLFFRRKCISSQWNLSTSAVWFPETKMPNLGWWRWW